MPATEDEKRKFIVNEIQAWRKSRLLPEHYCDFLQNLYLDDLSERPTGTMEAIVRKIGKASGKHWFLVSGIFVLICIAVLHFSAFPLSLQIGLAGLVTTGFVALGGALREKKPVKSLLALGGGMVFLFGAGAAILQLHGWTEGIGPIVLLGVCAIMCIGCGLIVRLALVHWFGWLAVAALYLRLLFMQIPHPSWGETQLFWIPASLLFIWLAWFSHIRFKSMGSVLFGMGFLLWFMPDLHAALSGVDPQWVQAGLLGKTLLAALGMYRLRKQWMEWVVR